MYGLTTLAQAFRSETLRSRALPVKHDSYAANTLLAGEPAATASLWYPADLAREVLARFAGWVESAPRGLSASVVLMNFSADRALPPALREQSFAIVRACLGGSAEESRAQTGFWRNWQAPILDTFQPAQPAGQDLFDLPPFLLTGGWLRDLSPATVEELVYHTLPVNGPSPIAFSEIHRAGGASNRLEWISVAVPYSQPMRRRIADHFAQMRAALAPALSREVIANFPGVEEAQARMLAAFNEAMHTRRPQ